MLYACVLLRHRRWVIVLSLLPSLFLFLFLFLFLSLSLSLSLSLCACVLLVGGTAVLCRIFEKHSQTAGSAFAALDLTLFLRHLRASVKECRSNFNILAAKNRVPIYVRGPIQDEMGRSYRFIKNSEVCRIAQSAFDVAMSKLGPLGARERGSLLNIAAEFGRRGDIASVLPSSLAIKAFEFHAKSLQKAASRRHAAESSSLDSATGNETSISPSSSPHIADTVAKSKHSPVSLRIDIGPTDEFFDDETSITLNAADVFRDIFISALTAKHIPLPFPSPSLRRAPITGTELYDSPPRDFEDRWPATTEFDSLIFAFVCRKDPDVKIAYQILDMMAV